ncbi:hypothetical protein AB0J86_23265 [Micromonospora sp. NPDC049559]|uniref:hypothetical protein n=1 Tax=Micromonospora sp. NPDC049559 TaxID=3155923 RepID=UPI00341636F3
MIPEEDRGPAWLRDYSAIEADISKMEEFAKQLRDEVTKNYAPHLEYVNEDMSVQLPPVDPRFGELYSFLTVHRESLAGTNEIVHHYRDATGGFATAADEVSKNYGNADAFSAARVKDVEVALDKTAAAKPTAPVTTDPYAATDTDIPEVNY